MRHLVRYLFLVSFHLKVLHPLGFPGGSDGKESACNVGDLNSIPGSGGCPGEENGNPLQYSRLENPMDGGEAWRTTIHKVAKSRTRLNDFTFTHSSILAWRIPWTEEPSGLQSVGTQRVVHD